MAPAGCALRASAVDGRADLKADGVLLCVGCRVRRGKAGRYADLLPHLLAPSLCDNSTHRGLEAREGSAIRVMHATCLSGGGRQMWFASVLRFCAIAARGNSSRAPERPRSRL